jgi:hypothetical protein
MKTGNFKGKELAAKIAESVIKEILNNNSKEDLGTIVENFLKSERSESVLEIVDMVRKMAKEEMERK